ncbi:heme-binding protein [Acidicapsa dinghuensis]|uniref:Heme-binding protein n=1 Tax=Acidicapsa dinghuensis TaxID=2218256 RepID=A0ABW1ENF9_9BACT|nr:heme-binding protein [Acidicapsa dinghuensis]
MKKIALSLLALAIGVCANGIAQPSDSNRIDVDSACSQLPAHGQLQSALAAARAQSNGGFNLDMWGTVVNRDGVVCAVAFTGANRGSQWPGSRVISAQKANTANAFSLPQLALSTANLYTAVQPGGSLYGLQASNPVNTDVAYRGDPADYGQKNDPMIGGRIGGVNVFGGGLALYNAKGVLIGAIGVSGDSSCADHNIAWRTRHTLKLDYVPAGVSGDAAHPDNIVYDITAAQGLQIGVSTSGWGHPACSALATSIAAGLPAIP